MTGKDPPGDCWPAYWQGEQMSLTGCFSSFLPPFAVVMFTVIYTVVCQFLNRVEMREI